MVGANNVRVVLGSALLWAWGFLCFLSPALFPERGGLDASIGLEYGFFASQASVVACAAIVVIASRWRRFIVKRGGFLVAAVLVALTTLVLAWAVRAGALGVIVACGIVDGGAVMLLGVAWGARYSLGSRRMRSLVVLSFLVAYLLYLAVAQLPSFASVVLVSAFPLVSWALWRSDAVMRHELSSEVFPSGVKGGDAATPGELIAGSWEARVLPWRAISVLIAATFIGNLMSSVVMGRSYASVDSLFFGGIAVCASIATMALVPLTARRAALSVGGVYRITVTFTAVGLVAVMVFGTAAVPVGGALVQGSAFFLQVLVFLVITQSTQELGLSPLLSFSVGQGLISGVVFAGNVIGKQVYALFGAGDFVLDVMCGLGLLALFFMLVWRAGETEEGTRQGDGVNVSSRADETLTPSPCLTAVDPESVVLERAARFAQSNGLTKREAEVLGYLARGRTLPYIADALFVTTGTVKTHTTHIYRKLDVSSRQELLDQLDAFE